MQIGFNSDVEHDGLRFHVQTEDLGLEDGRITSQVFREGQIIDTLTVSYAKAVAKLADAEARDEEIRKRMKALHALCFRNVRSGKYEAQMAEIAARTPSGQIPPPAREGPPPIPAQAKNGQPPRGAAEGDAYVPGEPLPVSGDPRDTADDEATPGERDPDPTIVMAGLPDPLPIGDRGGGGAEPEALERDIDVVEEVVVENVTVESDLISLDSLPLVSLVPPPQMVGDAGKGVRYRRDARAYRGIDVPDDPDLLGLLANFRT